MDLLPEWFVGLLEPPHELFEYVLALSGLLLLGGLVAGLLWASRRGRALKPLPSIPRRPRRQPHRAYLYSAPKGILPRQLASRRSYVKLLPLLLIGVFLLVGWIAQDRSSPVSIRRGTGLVSVPAGGSGIAYYPNCLAARAAGAAPIYAGEPGYRSPLDRDGDGVACEPWP